MSEKIIISCDTTVALSKEEIEKNGFNVIPLNAIADGKEYHDTVDIDSIKLCKLMRNGAKISTSTPTITEIQTYFDNLFEKTQADRIIHFTISSKLSSMFSLFTTVCNERYGDKVIVVDSLSICAWIERQVIYARSLVEQGYNAETIVEKVKKDLVGTEDCVFIPESLEYLKRGGRISGAAAAFANLIGVLPVLTFNNGEVGKKGVTRTTLKAILTALNEWAVFVPNFKTDYDILTLINDTENEDKIGYIKEAIIDVAKNEFGMNVVSKQLSLNVTAHTGPGTFGIGILKKIPEAK